jgi:glycine/D-amino acid oxidase-like deaminating enzyme
MKKNYDVIVVGGGAMGLSTAYHLAKNKTKTLVLERFRFLNEFGSSAGVSRQFRIPYPEPYMVQMVLDSVPWWQELQGKTDKQLLDKVGTLWFGDPEVKSTEGNIKVAEASLKEKNVPFTTHKAKEIEKQYNFRDLPANYVGLFQPDGASIDLKATLETLLKSGQDSSYVDLMEDSQVKGIRQKGKLFEVTTAHGTYTSEKLVLTPGPYIDEVARLLNFGTEVIYWNMSSCYFKKTDPKVKFPTWFVFQNPVGKSGNEFYGFPEVEWDNPGYIRVAPDFVMKPLTVPEQRTSVPNKQELKYTSDWVKEHMKGLDPKPYFKSTCFVALSKNQNKELIIDFAPDYVPNHKNIVIYATGWAGKFVPLMGKILSDLTLKGKTKYDISNFKLGDEFFKKL